jgi:hypothetical protein
MRTSRESIDRYPISILLAPHRETNNCGRAADHPCRLAKRKTKPHSRSSFSSSILMDGIKGHCHKQQRTSPYILVVGRDVQLVESVLQ